MTDKPDSQPAVGAFHKHLDSCPRCSDNPWDLCLTGEWLLLKAATEMADMCKKRLEVR